MTIRKMKVEIESGDYGQSINITLASGATVLVCEYDKGGACVMIDESHVVNWLDINITEEGTILNDYLPT